MFLPFRNAEIMSAVSFSLSQKCAGSSYPYIRNGFFILPVIQVVNIITQIALRKLCNKITVFLSYHQAFRSRIEIKLLLSRNVYLGFCKSLVNKKGPQSEYLFTTYGDLLFIEVIDRTFIIERRNILAFHQFVQYIFFPATLSCLLCTSFSSRVYSYNV